MNKNLVVITCALNVQKDSVFSLQERFQQVFMSIESVRRKIPNSFIVLLEVGTAPDELASFLKQHVDEYFIMNVADLNKNQGEATMMYRFLKSELFTGIRSQFTHFNKLSGRYFLNDEFDFNRYDLEKVLIKHRLGESGEGLFETRYFRIPMNHIDSFIEKYDILMNEKIDALDYDDVEHIYYRQGFFTLENTIHNVPIYVSGWISGSGHFITD